MTGDLVCPLELPVVHLFDLMNLFCQFVTTRKENKHDIPATASQIALANGQGRSTRGHCDAEASFPSKPYYR